MRMPSGIACLKFFKKKFPQATADDVSALVNLMSSAALLSGMYTAASLENTKHRKEKRPEPGELQREINDMTMHPWARNWVLLQFFGVDKTKFPDFDPVVIGDEFGSKAADRLFGIKR